MKIVIRLLLLLAVITLFYYNEHITLLLDNYKDYLIKIDDKSELQTLLLIILNNLIAILLTHLIGFYYLLGYIMNLLTRTTNII